MNKKGMRVIAIGDIHGHDHLLKSVLRQIEEKYIDKKTAIVFMGDYINRSPSPEACRSTLSMIKDFEARYPTQTYLLRGNHEWNFIQKVELDNDQLNISKPWELEIYHDFEKLLKSTLPYFETEQYFFSHAGGVMKNGRLARKELTLEESYALYWRYDLPDVPYEKIVVRAHKIVELHEVFGKNLVNIDLGSYKTGKLGAVILPENTLIVSE